MDYQVNCPHCHALLKSTKPPPPGKGIRCLKCRGHFTVRQIDDTTLISAPFQPPPRFRSPLAITLALAGLLLFVGGGAALVVYCVNLPDDETALAENANSDDDDLDPPEVGGKNEITPKTPIKGKKKIRKNKSAKPPPSKESPKKAAPKKQVVVIEPPPDFGKAKKPPTIAPPDWIPKAADGAIVRGVDFLKTHFGQKDLAKWSEDEVRIAKSDPTGMLALAGMALLESGVLPTDPLIVAAHRAILSGLGRVDKTYDLGLSILFLDRLGKKEDDEYIQRLALQLIARQNPDGGWPYTCPPLNVGGGKELLRFLQDNRLTMRELAHPQEFLLAIPGQKQLPPRAPDNRKERSKEPSAQEKKSAPANTALEEKPHLPFRADQLPAGLQKLPVVTQPKVTAPQANGAVNRSDNSNTQFALLGLWIAQKHGVPMERTFNLVDQRFRQTQAADGSWAYAPDYNPVPPAMTCAGLLGLAVGHGSAQQVVLGGARGQTPAGEAPSITDPLIQNGLKFVGQNIGSVESPNTYFLWSVERVAVLYHLDTIGGKDWYSWGARVLIDSQRGDGSWFFNSVYSAQSPVVDTSFALLFLKKADFVPGLGRELQQYIRVRDPEPSK